MTTLNELIILSAQIEARLVSGEGEVDEALADLMVQAEQLPSKVDSIAFVLESMESRKKQLKDKIEAIRKAHNAVENAEVRLRDYVKSQMMLGGLKEIQGTSSSFKLSSGGSKLVLENEALIPHEYTITVLHKEPNKEAIKAALMANESVEGCSLEPITKLLKRIK